MANFPVPEPQYSKPLPPFAANITGGANCFDVRYLQTLDNNTASSILQFFVRQRVIPEYVINAVFLALPLANPFSFSLKKDILLRRLASELVLRSVSEETLSILELIEELDRKSGCHPPSEAMKAAYCAVASSCTAAAFHQNVDDFLDSFHRIWVLRICDIEKSAAAALISEELREVRDIFWEAVKDPKLRPLVVNIDLEETLDRVRDYLEEVWDMEPLFPEVAVDEIEAMDASLRIPGERRDPREGPSGLKNQMFGCAEHTELERLVIEEGMKAQNGIDEPIVVSDSEFNGPLDQHKGLEISKRSSQQLNAGVEKEQDLKSSNMSVQRMLQDTLLDPGNKATKVLPENSEACNEKFKRNNGHNGSDKLISDSEIGSKVAGTAGKQIDVDDEQALKANYLDLRRMLQNTLLDAANKAIELRLNDVQNRTDELASTSRIGTNDNCIDGNETSAMLNKYPKPSCLKEKEENQNGQDLRGLMASFQKVLGAAPDEENHTKNKSNLASLPIISLMERNPTAHTVEWSESPSREPRFHLRSPKRELISPLKLIDDKRYAKRRKIRKWTLLEEETLIKAVREHGKGSWKQILSNYPEIFEERTEVDLKDKWRNMTKSSLTSCS